MNDRSVVDFPGESRVHIGLAVTELNESRRFYETLLGVPPCKERPGYVKFEPQSPSVNLSLNQVTKAAAGFRSPTHYGIQVKSTQAVQDALARLTAGGLETAVETSTTCCYAVQDKVWVTDPDGNSWEVFVVLDDSAQRKDEKSTCCAADAPQVGGCC